MESDSLFSIKTLVFFISDIFEKMLSSVIVSIFFIRYLMPCTSKFSVHSNPNFLSKDILRSLISQFFITFILSLFTSKPDTFFKPFQDAHDTCQTLFVCVLKNGSVIRVLGQFIFHTMRFYTFYQGIFSYYMRKNPCT